MSLELEVPPLGQVAAGALLGAVPADVFITEQLLLRAPKKTDYLQEKLALQDLARQMADHPADVLPHLVDLAIEICGGVSGGISLYEENPSPGVFRWQYLRGDLQKFTGGTTPRDFSPCGVTLDLRTPMLAEHPERYYSWPWLQRRTSLPCMPEGLEIVSFRELRTLVGFHERCLSRE